MTANTNGLGVVPQDYDYPGDVIGVDCGMEVPYQTHAQNESLTHGPVTEPVSPKSSEIVGNSFAPVAPDTGPSQIYGS